MKGWRIGEAGFERCGGVGKGEYGSKGWVESGRSGFRGCEGLGDGRKTCLRDVEGMGRGV